MRVPLLVDAAELANMAYWSKEALESVTVEPSNVTLKLTQPIVFYETPLDAQCFVSRYEDGCCFVFRGTTNIQDWMINADISKDYLYLPKVKKESCPRVHRGFMRQFQSLERTLLSHTMEYINDPTVKESNRTLYYIGHSLGGALATIAATVFGAMYPKVRHVCLTFGSPRVGDANFVREFNKHCDESIRSVNQEDPVPMIPLSCNYTHVPGLVYFDTQDDLHREIVENRLVNVCRDSCLCWCGLTENPIDDHDMTQYIHLWKKCYSKINGSRSSRSTTRFNP